MHRRHRRKASQVIYLFVMIDRRKHWDAVYRSKSDDELSWTQRTPTTSLALISQVCPPGGAVIDVGGGTSPLATQLLDGGFGVTVLDISAAAMERARARLGERGGRVQ